MNNVNVYVEQATKNSDRLFLLGNSRYLSFFIIAYSITLLAANLFDPRLIKLLGLNTGAGAILFPLTYLLSDIITEVYGYKNARLAIWVGLLFNVVFLIYAQLIIYLSPSWDSQNQAFDQFHYFNCRIFFISIISYLITEQLNSYLVSRLKILFSGKFVGIRFIMATMLAHAINAPIFCIGAFYGTMSIKNLVYFIFSSWIFMLSIELLLVPIATRFAKRIKKIEQLDIYDTETNYSIMTLDSRYHKTNNSLNRET